ncbi:STAS domain-containing protein [Flindersiella endophytica]
MTEDNTENDSAQLDIQTEISGGSLVIRPIGEIDMATAPQLRRALLRLLASSRRPVVIDMAGVEFIDSSGIGALIAGYQCARQLHRPYGIAAPRPQARKVLSVTALDRVIPVHLTLAEACAA